MDQIKELCTGASTEVLQGKEFKEKLPFFHDGLFACSAQDAMYSFLRGKLSPTFVAQTTQAKAQARNYVDYISSSWGDSSDDPARVDKENGSIEIFVMDSDTGRKSSLTIGLSSTLKSLFNKYAEERGESLRSLRFTYADQTLFLSTVGLKTPKDLGWKNLDTIVVFKKNKDSPASPIASKETRPRSTSPPSGVVKQRKFCRRNSWTCSIDTSSVEYRKIAHSRALTRLFEEAEPKFQKIRQRLNLLDLECSHPKTKARPQERPVAVNPVDNPGTDGFGGKAGKVFFAVQIGEVQNLYKTSKPASSKSLRPKSVDLHGLTREEALLKLEEKLPQWVETAMSGEYPFVIPALIITGGGCQILSETVEQWIKEKDQVANAPKRMPSRRHSVC